MKDISDPIYNEREGARAFLRWSLVAFGSIEPLNMWVKLTRPHRGLISLGTSNSVMRKILLFIFTGSSLFPYSEKVLVLRGKEQEVYFSYTTDFLIAPKGENSF